jgi:hypothetical protein
MIPSTLPQEYKELSALTGIYDMTVLNELINLVHRNFPLDNNNLPTKLFSYTIRNEGSISTTNGADLY